MTRTNAGHLACALGGAAVVVAVLAPLPWVAEVISGGFEGRVYSGPTNVGAFESVGTAWGLVIAALGGVAIAHAAFSMRGTGLPRATLIALAVAVPLGITAAHALAYSEEVVHDGISTSTDLRVGAALAFLGAGSIALGAALELWPKDDGYAPPAGY